MEREGNLKRRGWGWKKDNLKGRGGVWTEKETRRDGKVMADPVKVNILL